MNTNSFNFLADEYIPAAPDAHISSPHSHLLATLLAEEDQHDYNQLLSTTLSHNILHILHQLSPFLQLSSSTTWTTIILLKKLLILQHDIDLLTIIACITLSSKYQHSSSHHIDYQLLAQHCHIHNIQIIHDAEMTILDLLCYDICVTTPDHFFSYLSNLADNHTHSLTQIIHQARSSLSHQTLELLSHYPSSIATLSLLLLHGHSSNTFIAEQIKSFVLLKKDPSHYLSQLYDCTVQLQSATSSSSSTSSS